MKSVKFSKSPLLSERLPQWRQRLVLVALLGAFLVLIGRSLYLQAFNNEFLGDKGRARFERVIDISATRGRITDRSGDVLAVSTPVKSIWAIPEDALAPAQARSWRACSNWTCARSIASWPPKAISSTSSASCRPTWRTGSRRSTCPASTRSASTAATTRRAR
jgi:cell division protein FtsI/penicillin-binding protein 2